MKKSEIKVGGIYIAKVSGKLTTVRVDAIREVEGFNTGESYWTKKTNATTLYDVTNLRTGRTTTFRSAAKFRSQAIPKGTVKPTAPEPQAEQAGYAVAECFDE